MPSFDVFSKVNWPEVDNARNQALKEATTRFDFKNIESKIEINQKDKLITLTTSGEGKMNALIDIFMSKLAKRGVSLLAFDVQKPESALSGGERVPIKVKAGIDKENAKKIVKIIKDQDFKAQAQIQDEQIRVTSKKRDELQEVIALLTSKQSEFKLPLQFGNFRE